MRTGFNFYLSYFKVFEMLETDEEKYEFLKALLYKQFYNEDPEDLSNMVWFAWESQKHSIDKQIKGFENKKGVKLDKEEKPWNIRGTLLSNKSKEKSKSKDKGKSKEKRKEKEKINKKEKVIPGVEEFISYAREKKPNVNTEAVKLKYEAWIANDWKDGNDKEVKNWKTKLLNTLPYLKSSEGSYAVNQNGEKINTSIL